MLFLPWVLYEWQEECNYTKVSIEAIVSLHLNKKVKIKYNII